MQVLKNILHETAQQSFVVELLKEKKYDVSDYLLRQQEFISGLDNTHYKQVFIGKFPSCTPVHTIIS